MPLYNEEYKVTDDDRDENYLDCDLTNAYNILFIGSTCTGKTVCMNAFIIKELLWMIDSWRDFHLFS